MSEYRVSDGWVPEARHVVMRLPGVKPIAHCYTQADAERIARALTFWDEWQRTPEQERADAYRALTDMEPQP